MSRIDLQVLIFWLWMGLTALCTEAGYLLRHEFRGSDLIIPAIAIVVWSGLSVGIGMAVGDKGK